MQHVGNMVYKIFYTIVYDTKPALLKEAWVLVNAISISILWESVKIPWFDRLLRDKILVTQNCHGLLKYWTMAIWIYVVILNKQQKQ